MNYKAARDYINTIEKKGSILGLKTMETLMESLGNVQERLSVIHIAGTNGKGSVSSYIASILQKAGYRIGRYASPAVFNDLEIISINGAAITPEEYGRYMGIIKDVITGVTTGQAGTPVSYEHEPTAFEIETALAFLYFYENKCDFVILETGMGGRLDATNIIRHPLCSVITSVSMDHMAFLGNTLEQIAREKAGIIKKNRLVITARQVPEVEKVLKAQAQQMDTELLVVNPPLSVEYQETGTTIRYESVLESGSWNLYTSMLGTFQVENVVLAVETIQCINRIGLHYNIREEDILEGIRLAEWKGRFQKISDGPRIFIDGGHNFGAAERLKETLEIYFTNSKIVFIMGVLRDKAYREILELLAPFPSEIITITPDNPRGLSGEELKEAALQYHSNVKYCEDLQTALDEAKQEAGTEGIILIFGSLSFLQDVMKLKI